MENKQKLTNQMVEDRLIDFASRVLDMVEALPATPAARHLGGQILRSSTSPALNYGEAQAAESKEDFLHKLKICLKELRETLICLKLIVRRKWFEPGRFDPLIEENNEIIAIFMTSTKTISENLKKSKIKSND
jgi:four helix bundle protein